MPSLSLSGQAIFITGASAGIGATLAKVLAAQYSDICLILTARNLEKLESVAQDCRTQGTQVKIIPSDLSDSQQVKAVVEEAVAQFGRIDILVNNAGYGQMGPIELVSLEAAKRQFDVNFFAPLILSQFLIPIMRKQGGGRIINISSLAGRMAFPAGGIYSSSKFALEALSDVLRMELKAFNIKVSVVEPGPVNTEFFQVAADEIEKMIPNPEKTVYRAAFAKIQSIEKQIALLGWEPEKVARIIIKAMSDNNPRPRYLAATGGSFFVGIMTKVLPTWMSDKFWKRFYGIDQINLDK